MSNAKTARRLETIARTLAALALEMKEMEDDMSDENASWAGTVYGIRKEISVAMSASNILAARMRNHATATVEDTAGCNLYRSDIATVAMG